MTTHASVQATSQESSVRLLPWWPCCILRRHHANTMTARMAFASNQWAPMITSANVHRAIQVCTECSPKRHGALIILVLNQGLQKYVKYHHHHHRHHHHFILVFHPGCAFFKSCLQSSFSLFKHLPCLSSCHHKNFMLLCLLLLLPLSSPKQ